MASAVYLLCALTSGLCAVLLLREYRRAATRLLFWSGLAFAGLTIANALVFTDLVVFPDLDLSRLRAVASSLSIALLVYGLVWDVD